MAEGFQPISQAAEIFNDEMLKKREERKVEETVKGVDSETAVSFRAWLAERRRLQREG
jgi:hypothetical protein